MGVVVYVASKLAQVAIVFLVIAFIPGLPPEMEFTAYSMKPTLPLEGKLRVNGKLDNAERLFDGELKGPEGLAVHRGELYTGIHGGHIVKVVDDKLVPVKKFGKACDGFYEEHKCGRVLGMKFDRHGALYASDCYYGLFKVNLTTGEHEILVDKDEVVEGRPVRTPNSIDVANDGTIYWSDSSSTHTLNDGVYVMLGDPTGRLVKYDPKTKKHKVLMENLHFANGVLLSTDESFVLVAETARARVWRYYLKGLKKGTSEVFIDGLPGYPDNLKPDGEGFFIPLVKPVDREKLNPMYALAPYPLVRKVIVRLATLLELSIKFFDDLLPNNVSLKKAMHIIGHFESMEIFSTSSRVTVVRTDREGQIVGSLHATDGRISDICDIQPHNGYYYLASPFNPYLARVPIS